MQERQEILVVGVLEKSRPAWNYLTQCAHRCQGLTPKGQRWGKLQMLSPTPEVGMILLKLLPSCEQVQVTAYIFPGGCRVDTAEGPTTLGPVPLGEHMIDLKLWQPPAGLCHCRPSLHIQTVSAVFFLLPGPSEQVSPNQLLLSPSLVQVGNRHWRAAHKRRQGQTQS